MTDAPPAPKPPRRRARLRACAAGVAVATGLLALEVGLRVKQLERTAASSGSDGWHVFDARLGWRGAPGWRGEGVAGGRRFPVRLDAQGRRMDRPVPERPPAGAKRVVVVGDSYPFGYGVAVEEALPARLEAALVASGVAVEVVNLGTCAWGVGHFRLATDELALPLRPDLIVVTLIADDLRRAQRAVSLYGQNQPRFVLDGDGAPRLVDVPVEPPPAAGTLRLADHPPGGGSFLLWQLGQGLERLRVAASGEGARTRWRVGLALLRDAHRVAQAAGVPLVVVLLPELKSTLDDEARPLVQGLEPEVPVVDLYPAFAPLGRAAFLEQDPHPSPAGQAAGAEALARALVERRLLRAP